MVVKSVVHFEIPASDVENLSKFYSDVFGWKFEKVPAGEMDYWMISTGPQNKSVGGGMYKKNGPNDGPRNFIAVDEIDGAIASFTTAGGKEIMGKQEVPGMGWSYIGVDPEGNMVGLWQVLPSRPAPRRSPSRRTARKSTTRRRRSKS